MKRCIFILGVVILNTQVFGQSSNNRFKDGLKLYLNSDSTHFLKATLVSQVWLRYNQNNPGSTVFNNLEKNTFDIGLRRTRIQMFGLISDRVFVYTQFGQNNFNYLSTRKVGAFFHDVVGEYAISPKHLWLGAGLTGWSGLSRYASPSVGTILSLDAPLFEQATNDATDQFLRKLSMYGKGKLGKLDYRVALSKPMAIENSTLYNSKITENSDFARTLPHLQSQGYFMYQFYDQESNQMPYAVGTYLGKKRVLNLGAGFIYQKDAMSHLVNITDSVTTALKMFAVDVFYDVPLNKGKGTAITAYAGYFNMDFGKGYVRNLGPMSPTNGVKAGMGSFNGTGSAYPIIGTGKTLYAQVGYLLPNKVLGKYGKLQPYTAFTYSGFDRLNDPVKVVDVGCNWLMNGHGSKLSFNYQNRPIFGVKAPNSIIEIDRKGCFILQYQISI